MNERTTLCAQTTEPNLTSLSSRNSMFAPETYKHRKGDNYFGFKLYDQTVDLNSIDAIIDIINIDTTINVFGDLYRDLQSHISSMKHEVHRVSYKPEEFERLYCECSWGLKITQRFLYIASNTFVKGCSTFGSYPMERAERKKIRLLMKQHAVKPFVVTENFTAFFEYVLEDLTQENLSDQQLRPKLFFEDLKKFHSHCHFLRTYYSFLKELCVIFRRHSGRLTY